MSNENPLATAGGPTGLPTAPADEPAYLRLWRTLNQFQVAGVVAFFLGIVLDMLPDLLQFTMPRPYHVLCIGIAVLGAAWFLAANAPFLFADLRRFQPRRVSAIAGVCFRESIRRRILWITPLAIVGIIAVTQLTRPVDEQDAVRQTVKYCLFASGLIVIVAAVILAATNLPKEIENRVIFTIVTKPTTRLEIVLGKVLGFALVSGMILLIMGGFTYGYARVRAMNMEAGMRAALEAGTADAGSAPALRQATDAGLLATRSLEWPTAVDIYSRVPAVEGPRYIGGARNQFFLAPFKVPQARKQEMVTLAEQNQPVLFFVVADVRLDRHTPTAQEREELGQGKYPFEVDAADLVAGPHFGPAAPTTGPTTTPATGPTTVPVELKRPIPQVSIVITDEGGNTLAADELSAAKAINAPPAEPGADFGQPRPFSAQLTGKALDEILNVGSFTVQVMATTPTIEYGADEKSTFIAMYQVGVEHKQGAAAPSPGQARVDGEYTLCSRDTQQLLYRPVAIKQGERVGFGPSRAGQVTAYAGAKELSIPDGNYLWLRKVMAIPSTNPADPNAPAMPRFFTQLGRAGMTVRGQPEDEGAAVAVFRFPQVDVGSGRDGKVGLQLKLAVERGGDMDVDRNSLSRASVQVRNRKNGQISPPAEFLPETSRFNYVDLPAEYFQGGDVDVLIRGLTPGQWLGVSGPDASTPSVGVITANNTFEFNLFKSLLILWVLSILVVTIAVFCSTFVSWPIAVVLTVLLLLGRWGVDQLGDAIEPGAARGIAGDIFGFRDAAKNKTVTTGMEALATMLRKLGRVLPDVAQFPVIEDINRGVNISGRKVGRAMWEAGKFGLPLVLLTYLVFRNKEVAP